jgi:N-dimethylarginine dimethylaminohydrolase
MVAAMPHYRGPTDVFHLMSVLSPIDHDLALVYSPLMPIPFREWLIGRGIALVEVPDAEFDSMGCNVLALAPRRCLMLEGNPRTRAALQQAGATVIEYDGMEISAKGQGGPTCLTRPLLRG